MSLRIFNAVFCALLASCGGPPDGVATGNAQEVGRGTPGVAPVERIACAIGDADYADACSIDRAATADGTLLTIRHPDGGFRRVRLSVDGRTVTAADGALPATIVSRSASGLEIAIGDARYRLPPTR